MFTVPSGLICSDGTIDTVVPAEAAPVILGRPERLAPKSNTYVGPGTLAAAVPSACGLLSAGVTVTPVPARLAVAPDACAADRAGANVTPVPVGPWVPAAVTVTASWFAPVSTRSV